MLLLQYLMHALSAFFIDDIDEIDACGQCSHVDMEFVVFALHAKYLLPEHVEHFGLSEILASDRNEAVGGVGMKVGEGLRFTIFLNTFGKTGLAINQWIVWDGAESYLVNIYFIQIRST